MCYYLVMIEESMRIRVIRAITGLNSSKFCEKYGIHKSSMPAWEAGRAVPNTKSRETLARICAEYNISIRPDGFPVPVSE